MKKMLLLSIFLTCHQFIFCQNCTVLVDSLKGSYVGSCKNGLANGTGTAKGSDMYTGTGKKGYPDGRGKYTWRNGNWYEGSWQHGIYQGEGVLHTMTDGTNASTEMKGEWQNGHFMGPKEEPYTVESYGNKINDVTVKKSGHAKDEITIIVKSITGGAATLTGGAVTTTPAGNLVGSNSGGKPKLTGIDVQYGSYTNKIDNENSPIANQYTLQNVVYPIKLLLQFDSEKCIIQILKNGSWNIDVKLDK